MLECVLLHRIIAFETAELERPPWQGALQSAGERCGTAASRNVSEVAPRKAGAMVRLGAARPLARVQNPSLMTPRRCSKGLRRFPF